MVGVLWTEGYFSAAMELEDLWNRLLSDTSSNLLCGYPIDVFSRNFHACDVEALLWNSHPRCPDEANHQLEEAIHRAMDEILGRGADVLLLATGFPPASLLGRHLAGRGSRFSGFGATFTPARTIFWLERASTTNPPSILLICAYNKFLVGC